MRFIPIFTDLDLAERFLEKAPDRGAGFNAIRTHTREELKGILTIFALQGDYALGVDPNDKPPVRLLPIYRALEALGVR